MSRNPPYFAALLCLSLTVPALRAGAGEASPRLRVDAPGRIVWTAGEEAVHLALPEILLGDDKKPVALETVEGAWTVPGREYRRTFKGGGLRVVERVGVDDDGIARRTLELAADAARKEPLKLRGVTLPARIGFRGRYWLPASDYGNGAVFDPEYKGVLADWPAGRRRTHPNNTFCPLLLDGGAGLSWLFMIDGRQDRAAAGLHRRPEGMFLIQEIAAAGWLEPGVAQTLAPVSALVGPGDLDAALATLPARWYAAHGIVADRDRLRDAVLYSAHPGGTHRSVEMDLGGFDAMRGELLPVIADLGANMVWLLPLEDQSAYWPRDYFKFSARAIGGEDAYRKLLDAFHARGIRVMRDLVPHGGTPAAGKLRGNNPFSLAFSEKGTVAGYWCFDFADPEWQGYVDGIARRYLEQSDALDGFRVDAINGSRAPSWRRSGFPAQRPANVDETWWNENLVRVGGSVPPLAYPRASLALRRGGLEMLGVIDKAVKDARPGDGLLFAESNSPAMAGRADAIYDSQFNHYTQHRLRADGATDFATGIMARLNEQYHADPPGLVRMRCVDSHDQSELVGWNGFAAWKALYAVMFSLPGMPMLYQDAEILQEIHLRKLVELRRRLPELSRGDAAYNVLPGQPKGVFSVRRRLDGASTLALVNLTPTARAVSLPVAGFTPSTRELLTGAAPGERLELPPWGAAYIVTRPAGEALPAVAPLYADAARTAAPSAGAVRVEREGDTFVATAPDYRAVVSSRTGMLVSARRGQTPVLGAMSFSRDETTAAARAATVEPVAGDGLRCVADGLSWTWRFTAAGIELELDAAGLDETNFLLAIPVASVGRWDACLAEGYLDDVFRTRHRHAKPVAPGSFPGYRQHGTPAQWNAETQPLSPARPVVRAHAPDASATFAFPAALVDAPANVKMLDRFGGVEGWHLALFLRAAPIDKDLPAAPAAGRVRLAIALSGGGGVDAPSRRDFVEPATLGDGPVLSHDSTEWVVRGAHGELRLSRAGGAIKSWRAPNGDKLLADGMSYTSLGFGRTNGSGRAKGYPSSDAETGLHLWRADGKLRMRFFGVLRDNGQWRSLERTVWFVNEYAFGAGPSVDVRVAARATGAPTDEKGFLAWAATVEPVAALRYDNHPARAVNAPGKGRAAFWNEGATFPRQIVLDAADAKPRLALSRLAKEGDAPGKIFYDSRKLFLTWMDGPSAGFPVGPWQAYAFTLAPGAP